MPGDVNVSGRQPGGLLPWYLNITANIGHKKKEG